MGGYGIEIDQDGNATAFGNGWFRELGSIVPGDLGDWQAMDVHRHPILDVPVNQRDLAVQALVRAAGLGNEYVIRARTKQ